MAIACHHHGLLQPIPLDRNQPNLLIGDINWFWGLIKKHIAPFHTAFPEAAFQYLLVLVPSPSNQEMNVKELQYMELFQNLARWLLLSTDHIGGFVGMFFFFFFSFFISLLSVPSKYNMK